ncbi:major pilin protein HafA [Canicola haemoglobinophilus]|uniref:Major pilin protein HafA n=1 Tax=Canicola haemoglobinophilus TaxID=733 RepID=A0AB38HDQ5_9PAST|nr:fimbrial protein [Canicola haemoglobinophilus]STO55395.1 major pilin protein HafA [Canicola haemoglobinophilus]STO67723.1 major pilin protein HafA [Canicola haemoglobinophilus]STO91854.1 major pilin protein HafA [Canicola haemoglobinophilus]
MKKLTALALMGALSSFTHYSFAADGMITFNGKIVDQTCEVENGSKNLTVKLPTVSKSSLKSNSNTAGETPFTISLVKCKASNPNTGQTVRLFFFNPATNAVDVGRGILNNTDTSNQKASNVGIQILDSTLTNSIPLGKPIEQYTSGTDKVALSANVALHYWARYYATGQATPGNVKATVQYNIAYD